MKIIQIVPSFLPFVWGVQVFADELHTELTAEGHTSFVITFATEQKHIGLGRNNIIVLPSVDIIYNFPIPAVWRKDFWTVWRQIQKLEPECIITHTRFFTSALLPLFLHRKKWIHIEHGTGFVEYGSILVRLIARVYDLTFGRLVLRSADEIIGISQAVAPFVHRLAGRSAQVLYRGFRIPETCAPPQTQTLWFLGRIVGSKGVFELVNSFSTIAEEFPNSQLLIAGTGSDLVACQDLAAAKKLTNRITFLEGAITPANNYSDFYNRIDIFVNPSYTEGLPTTVIEALMAQRLVIATDVGGTNEISTESDLILIPAKDEQALTQALRHALTADEYTRLQGRSFPTVTQKFSWKTLITLITQENTGTKTVAKEEKDK